MADNNVQDVLSTIDNYQSGAVRALAQDPPQNSSDARRNGTKVKVEYTVHHRKDADGADVVLLTITDMGTTGLDGLMLTADELGERELDEGELVIRQGENWAAWEAMRYTKAGEDKLGSRGQGKYAYMYHSAHPPPALEADPDSVPRSNWRMVILYDTLLPSGEYRLGVRYHTPSAKVVDPFTNEEARDVLRDGYEDGVFAIPLGLEPLGEVGTRVIIPFLSFEAREAIDSGELHRWLRLEWWRQIQKEELSITVDSGDGLIQEIGVPRHWANSPWERDSENYFVKEHVDLIHGGGWKIKRLVLFYDEALDDEDCDGNPQEVGIQLLRGGQWIMTLGASEFSDIIPREHRKGIRGFVEFDRPVEAELREIENPAHDGFNKRKSLYQETFQTIKGLVEEFARERGWLEEKDATESSYDDLLSEVTKVFVEPDPGPGPGLVEWLCRVSVTCQAGGRKADWGESIEIAADCRRVPVGDGDTVEFRTMLVRPDGSETEIFAPRRQRLTSRPGREYSSAGCDFGRLDVVHPGADPRGHFRSPGRYSIVVRCTVDGREVAQGRTGFYVDDEPPSPPPRLIGMELHACNGDTRSERFEDGDALSVVAIVRNYGPDAQDAELNIAVTDLEDGVLLREAVSVPGVPLGTPPEEATRVTDKRTVREVDSGDPGSLVLPKGRHEIRASFERSGELLATARVVVIVGDDDDDDEARNLPFTLESDNRSDAARWIYKPAGAGILPTVVWSDGNPVFEELSGAISDQYVVGIIVEGVIEWAVRAYEDGGDEGGLTRMTEGVRRAAPELLNEMEDRIDRLKGVLEDASDSRDVFEYGNAQRRLASVMTLVMRQSAN